MKNIIIIIALTFFLQSCLTTRSQLKDQSKAPKTGAVLIEEGTSVEAKSEVPTEIEMKSPQGKAQMQMKLQEYEQSMRQMTGRIEALEHKLRQSQSGAISETQKVTSEGEKLKLYEEALEKMQKEIERLKAEKGTTVVDSSGKATVLSQLGDYQLAEERFAKKEWKKAIIQYQKYRDKNPKGKSYAMATYKIGVCFQELGLVSEAKSFYKEVMDKFPGTIEYKKARYRHNRL